MAETAPPARRARNLLSSYYGASVAVATEEVDDMNIDATHFNADKYVSSLLQNKSLPELMQRGIAMVSEIKSLDSDMQMLVYDNYNQFISATDTIRKMKTRVEEMETQMGQLETNMGTISAASDSVNSSLSDRRSQLEGLNNVKRNLTKLQFLMDLPARLQASVDAGEYGEAVDNHRRAQRILRAVGHVASFHGIREEAATIMRRLTETLNARLQEPELPAAELGTTTRLLLLLDGGNEDQLLKDYLARRRRALQEHLTTFTPTDKGAEKEAVAWQDRPASEQQSGREGEGGDGADAATGGAKGEGGDGEGDGEEEGEELSAAASYVAQLGGGFGPLLVQLHTEWQRLLPPGSDAAATADAEGGGGGAGGAGGAGGGAAGGGVVAEQRRAMILDALQELAGGFLEMCRRRLQEEQVEAAHLVQGLGRTLDALRPLDGLVPQAKLLPRATRMAEQMAKGAIDERLQTLQTQLVALATDGLQTTAGAAAAGATGGGGAGSSDEEPAARLAAAVGALSSLVQTALDEALPLLLPLSELLGLRADGTAKHLVTRLQTALAEVATAALAPSADAAGVLLRAGLCARLAAPGGGVVHVQALLKRCLGPDGLGHAASMFEVTPTQRQFSACSDKLVAAYVEMEAQAIGTQLQRALRQTDWLKRGTPREVTPLVEGLMASLRSMQSLASQVFAGGEPSRSLLPQGPFPASTATATLSQGGRGGRATGGMSAAGGAAGAGAAGAIHKDMQRLFARKISFAVELSGGGKAPVARMMTHVVKLTLKTLVEEARLATYGRGGFEQLQIDCAMLRWVLPACVDDDGDVLALLDETLTSCQERCVDVAAVDHSVLEGLCERKRQQLLLALG